MPPRAVLFADFGQAIYYPAGGRAGNKAADICVVIAGRKLVAVRLCFNANFPGKEFFRFKAGGGYFCFIAAAAAKAAQVGDIGGRETIG